MIDDPAEADIGQAQRFFAVVRDEQGAGRHDARFAPLWRRREISVDDRMLEVRKRCVRRRLGSRQRHDRSRRGD
jgi:hypothetical protein